MTDSFFAGGRDDRQPAKHRFATDSKIQPSQRETNMKSRGWHRLGAVLAVLAMLPFLYLSFIGAEGVIWGIIFIGLGVSASIYGLVRLYGRIIASLGS